jgi:hypothetical protein
MENFLQNCLLLLVFSTGVLVATGIQIPTIQSLDEITFDDNHRLPSHVLFYRGGPNCDYYFEHHELNEREILKIGPELFQNYFSDVKEGKQCHLICLERGQQYDHMFHPLPYQKTSIEPGRELGSWIEKNCQPAEIGFMSYQTFDAEVYWIDSDGSKHFVGPLKPGEKNTFWIESYLGHNFEIVNPADHSVLAEYTVEYNSILTVGQYTSRKITRNVHKLVKDTLHAEWERAHRVVRTFTEFGFDEGTLPVDLFASMSAYYYNNQHHATIEEWESKGVFVNWWETDVFFVSMPFRLKVISEKEDFTCLLMIFLS